MALAARKNAFHPLIVGFDDQQPHDHGRDGHREVLGDPEDLHAGRHPGELADGVGQIGEQKDADDQRGETHTQPLADQIGQALARDDPQPRAHLLHDDQRQGHQGHHPQQAVTVVGARY